VVDNGVELGECVVFWCEQQDSLLKEQRETLCSLEADRDEVGPVEPNEMERMSAANGYTWSLGGKEIPGLLGLTRIPEVIVPVCVVKCTGGASVSKGVQNVSHGVRECVRGVETRTDSDARLVWRAFCAIKLLWQPRRLRRT